MQSACCFRCRTYESLLRLRAAGAASESVDWAVVLYEYHPFGGLAGSGSSGSAGLSISPSTGRVRKSRCSAPGSNKLKARTRQAVGESKGRRAGEAEVLAANVHFVARPKGPGLNAFMAALRESGIVIK
jgi:hypothetical protein